MNDVMCLVYNWVISILGIYFWGFSEKLSLPGDIHDVCMPRVQHFQLLPIPHIRKPWKMFNEITNCILIQTYRRSQVRHHVVSPKPGTQVTLGSLAISNLVKYTAFLAFFLEILVEEKLGPSLV